MVTTQSRLRDFCLGAPGSAGETALEEAASLDAVEPDHLGSGARGDPLLDRSGSVRRQHFTEAGREVLDHPGRGAVREEVLEFVRVLL